MHANMFLLSPQDREEEGHLAQSRGGDVNYQNPPNLSISEALAGIIASSHI